MEPVLLQQWQRGGRHVRGRRSVAQRPNAEPVECRERALHVGALLVGRLVTAVDVRVGVMGDLMAGAEERLAFARERLDRVTWDEERGRQVQRIQAIEKSRHPDAGPVLPALQHRRGHGLLVKPDGQRIEVERQADAARRYRL